MKTKEQLEELYRSFREFALNEYKNSPDYDENDLPLMEEILKENFEKNKHTLPDYSKFKK